MGIASENEWYKAAYYSGASTGADGDGYWLYPTQSNTAPAFGPPFGVANSANYTGALTVTDVGAYTGSASHYGTSDQGGNVWEWNDTVDGTSGSRGRRGGAVEDGDYIFKSSFRGYSLATLERDDRGFRVTSLAPFPELSAYSAILGCLGLGLALTRRKGRA